MATRTTEQQRAELRSLREKALPAPYWDCDVVFRGALMDLLADAATAAQLEKELSEARAFAERLCARFPEVPCEGDCGGVAVKRSIGQSYCDDCAEGAALLNRNALATLRAAVEAAKAREEALHARLDENKQRYCPSCACNSCDARTKIEDEQ